MTMHEMSTPALDGHGGQADDHGHGGRRVARELFPLPVLPQEAAAKTTLSRGCKQRIGKRRGLRFEVNRTVRSLNLLHGGPGGSRQDDDQLPSLAQQRSLEFIEHSVRELGPSGSLTGPEALEALRISEDYGAPPAPSALGSFDPDLISLPTEELRPVDLGLAWGEGGQQVVEEFSSPQMLGPDATRIQSCGIKRLLRALFVAYGNWGWWTFRLSREWSKSSYSA